jgi:hypothetical protein
MRRFALALPLLTTIVFASTANAADDYTITLDATNGINAAYPTGKAYGAAGVDGLNIYDNTTHTLITASSTYSLNDFLGAKANNGATFDFIVDYVANNNGDILDLGFTSGAAAVTYQNYGTKTKPILEGIKINGSLVAFDHTPAPTSKTDSFAIYDDQVTLTKGLNIIELFGKVGPAGSQQVTEGITVTPVPEPEQWAMLLLGLPLIARFVNRKKMA